jgi:hypothetical protein
MHRSFVAELSARRPALKMAWERKLRHEPITSPLANPDTLVLMMDRTLDELESALRKRCVDSTPPTSPMRGMRAGCLCGLNPLLAYFRIGANVLSTLMSNGADRCPELGALGFAGCLQEMIGELHLLAQEEIRSFCAMCQTEIARGGKTTIGSAIPSHAAVEK